MMIFTPSAVPGAEAGASDDEIQRRIEFDLELDAYYTNASVTFSLTDKPIRHLGERPETEIYRILFSQSLLPRYLVLEASINPLPYLGTYIKREHRRFYDNAEISGSFNWVKTITTGFEEPWAASVLVGNVIDFDLPGHADMKGKGYAGFLASAGNYHIKDNEMIKDDWREFEWKVKGDRKSSVRKLSWSFRVGAKLHENPYITDIIYISLRRSRLDYKIERSSILNNSGFEYTFDMNRRGFGAIRHYFFVDKKWPFEKKKMAFTFAMGFVWESARKYSGPLAAGRESDDFQIILRPNIEF